LGLVAKRSLLAQEQWKWIDWKLLLNQFLNTITFFTHPKNINPYEIIAHHDYRYKYINGWCCKVEDYQICVIIAEYQAIQVIHVIDENSVEEAKLYANICRYDFC
jgi:hypothetical protein